jgi:hypothetical protein
MKSGGTPSIPELVFVLVIHLNMHYASEIRKIPNNLHNRWCSIFYSKTIKISCCTSMIYLYRNVYVALICKTN